VILHTCVLKVKVHNNQLKWLPVELGQLPKLTHHPILGIPAVFMLKVSTQTHAHAAQQSVLFTKNSTLAN
jgi:hypothetical protein